MEEKLEKLACVLKVGKTCLCPQDSSAEMSLKAQVYMCTGKQKYTCQLRLTHGKFWLHMLGLKWRKKLLATSDFTMESCHNVLYSEQNQQQQKIKHYVFAHMHACLHTQACMLACTHRHARTHARTHARMHTRTHTHTHTHKWKIMWMSTSAVQCWRKHSLCFVLWSCISVPNALKCKVSARLDKSICIECALNM